MNGSDAARDRVAGMAGVAFPLFKEITYFPYFSSSVRFSLHAPFLIGAWWCPAISCSPGIFSVRARWRERVSWKEDFEETW